MHRRIVCFQNSLLKLENLCSYFLANRKSYFLYTSQGTTLCQASIICIIIGFLYVSRAVYNIVAVIPHGGLPTFGYGWINVSDEVCQRSMNVLIDKIIF